MVITEKKIMIFLVQIPHIGIKVEQKEEWSWLAGVVQKNIGLIEDELTCTVDASNISVQGMSFILKEDISQFLRKIKTDELFCAKTKYNQNNEVTSGFLCHQIIKKSFEVNIPNFYLLLH